MKHLDLFSGIGGFALAAQACGWETIAFSEIDPYANRVLHQHWPSVPNLGPVEKLCRRVYDCDYSEETGDAWCPRCETDFGDCDCIGTDEFTDTHGFPDLITGGVPCQPASIAGHRRGTADERWLWPEAIRIVRELRPRFCLFENPTALLTLESGRAFNGIVSGLVACGYDLWWDCIPACAVGAPHRRDRVWILAYAGHESGRRWPKPDESQSATLANGCKTVAVSQSEGLQRCDNGRDIGATFPGLGEGSRPIGREWKSDAGIRRVAHGIPNRSHRLKALGNAIVPQVAYVILKAIAANRLSQEVLAL